MSFSVEHFVDGLVSSDLLTAADLRDLERQLSSDGRYWNSEAVASHLVQQGKLTEYQAHLLRQGETDGLVLGDYVVLDKIGVGGMGEVFKAVHRRMDRTVALKVLSPEATRSAELVARFQREAKAAARLEHPNIVTAYDAGEANGTHFLVMQFINGCDLAAYVRDRCGCLPVAEAVDFILQAARGLEHAHSQGILHRDIKPSNLLLDQHGVVRILDLGLAIFVDQIPEEDRALGDRLTVAGERLGTANYMSPEQAVDTRSTDARSDIYSLGCTLHFLLTGEPPYRRHKKLQVVVAHRNAPIPSLCQQFVDIPVSLDDVFQKMLAKAPEERYQTMSEVVAALEQVARSDLPNASICESSSIDPDGPTSVRGVSPLTDFGGGDRTVGTNDTVQIRANQDTELLHRVGDTPDPKASRRVITSAADDTTDRRTALWVLHTGGGVVISVARGGRFSVSDAVDLPRGEFAVETVGLAYNKLVTDKDIEQLTELAHLARLYLDGTNISDAALTHLPGIRSLIHLALGKTSITDAGLTEISRCKNLRQLSLYATKVSDRGVDVLAKMRQLEKLNLARTKIGQQGLAKLRRALSSCEITS